MPKIKINKAGVLSTIQDLGRYGYQQFGMPVSGAMDSYSLKLANLLVGNNLNEACIEATLSAPHIQFESKTYIAICGADMQAQINGRKIPMYETIAIKATDKLSFGKIKNGFRTYIAFAGGIDVPMLMGSKSTYLAGKIGGFNGRKLIKGDVLTIGTPPNNIKIIKAKKEQIPLWPNHIVAHIIAGPEANYFTAKALANFLGSEFKLSAQSDRMGYQLTGKKIEHKLSADIISSGIAFGSIQVPAHGQPIIMMADRQTTGGYARIANVISADLPYLAQLMPGSSINFKEVTLEQAHKQIIRLGT